MTAQVGRFLRRLVVVSTRRPAVTIIVALALAGLGIGYAVQVLTFKTATRYLLPRGQRYQALYEEHTNEFGELESIVVVVSGRTKAESQAYVTELASRLRASPLGYGRVTYRIDPATFGGRALLYMPLDELSDVRDKVLDHQEFLRSVAARPTLDGMVGALNQEIGRAFVGRLFDLGLEGGSVRGDFRFLQDLLGQMAERLDGPAAYRSPWGQMLSAGGPAQESGYFASKDGRFFFLFVEPPEVDPPWAKRRFAQDKPEIGEIRREMRALEVRFPGVQAGVTGSAALSNDERVSALQDSEVAALLAFGLTLALLIAAFRRVGKPLLMLAVLALSLAWSVGAIALTIGHLTIFSVVFISIVVGLGIDYGIYFLYRYEEERAHGRTIDEALERTAVWSGPGIVAGALAAVATFGVLTLTDFRGVQEFGFVSGLALLLACLAMLTVFPAALVLVDRRGRRGGRPGATWLSADPPAPADSLPRYPSVVLVLAGVVTAGSLWAVPNVRFDYDLLDLQATGIESVVWERRILEAAKRSGFTALAIARTPDELERKQAAFEALPSVAKVESLLTFVPNSQPDKLRVISQIAPVMAGVRVGEPEPFNLTRLRISLGTMKRRLDLAVAEAGPGGPPEMVVKTRDQIDTLLRRTGAPGTADFVPALEALQRELARDLRDKIQDLQGNLHPRRITLRDVPEDLRRTYVGRTGQLLLQVQPSVDIWTKEGATGFVTDLRSVDPDVTGSAIISYEASRLMEEAYRRGTILAFLVVAGLSALLMQQRRETALSMIPLALGPLWTVGLMYAFALKFNLANVWGLPLIIGAAAEYGLNVVVRAKEARATGGPLLARSTALAVLLNGLTTVAGFASLMVARHHGIRSLGLLLTIGAVTSLIAALVVLPVLLRGKTGR